MEKQRLRVDFARFRSRVSDLAHRGKPWLGLF